MNKQKNDKRRQHYVPKFYLRNFSEDKKSIGIYFFEKNKIINHASIKDNLWKEYFYTYSLQNLNTLHIFHQ